jgi:hypothetical protein
MITHNLQQGTPEWHAFRAAHFTASDAPALQPVAEVAQPVSPAPVQAVASSAPRSAPTLKLVAIHDRLGFTVTADFLRSLGFAPHAEGAAKLYHEEDFPLICRAIVQHVEAVAGHQLKRAA